MLVKKCDESHATLKFTRQALQSQVFTIHHAYLPLYHSLHSQVSCPAYSIIETKIYEQLITVKKCGSYRWKRL